MKKSLLALAVLGAFATAASAQSSVTMYGRLDLSVGKQAGEANKGMFNGSGSRLGMKGVEDLGGGLQAIFNIEHRFEADTGAISSSSRFWHGISVVGFQGGFGKVTLGREYKPSFSFSQSVNDPWGWDTVAAKATTPVTTAGLSVLNPGYSPRNDSALTYTFGANGFNVGVQVAEATDTLINANKKPVSFGASYAGGPFGVNVGYDITGFEGAAKEKVATFGAYYNFGPFIVGATAGKSTSMDGHDGKSMAIGAIVPMGAGQLRAALGQVKADLANDGRGSFTAARAFALGYHYSLSKRTTLYADMVRFSSLDPTVVALGSTIPATATNRTQLAARSLYLINNEKTGYDFGVKHNF